MPRSIDITGQRYGRLVVIGRAKGKDARNAYWECICDCGNRAVVSSSHLTHGDTASCGCWRKDSIAKQFTTHGESRGSKRSKEYRIWLAMRERCCCASNAAYKDYGGRGIAICDDWLNSFEKFLLDMGRAPKGHSIERKDNSKGYSKENCVWATPKQQNNNRRDNIHIAHNGESLTITTWAERSGINRETIYQRIKKLGWTIGRALTTPVRRNHK